MAKFGGKQPGAGRPKGSRNKATAPIREAIEAEDPIGQLFELAKTTDNEDLRARCLMGVLPYAFPRLAASSVDLKAALTGDTVLNVNLSPKK